MLESLARFLHYCSKKTEELADELCADYLEIEGIKNDLKSGREISKRDKRMFYKAKSRIRAGELKLLDLDTKIRIRKSNQVYKAMRESLAY